MRVLRASLAAILLVLGLLPAAVLAVGPLEMTTAYPAVVSDPGATAKFPVTVITDVPQRVDLSVKSQPDGWTTRLRGAGSTIAAVTTSSTPAEGSASPAPTSANIATFTAEVDVPADVQPGNNQVVIEGRTASGTTVELTFDITIESQAGGAVTFTTEFPNQKGPTSTTFRFNATLTNDTNQQIEFSLEPDALPGWTITAAPAGQTNATTALVDAGSDQAVDITAKAPADTPADLYDFTVTATGGGQNVQLPLQVEITGSYSMTLDTTDGRLNARVTAGQSSVLNVIVTNTGTAPLTGVKLTATPPRDWTVSFNPDTLEGLQPGVQNAVSVPVTITASNNALAGDYLLTINARATENSTSDSIEVRTTVETSPIGYVIGIAILVIVAVGLFFVFQRYGRR